MFRDAIVAHVTITLLVACGSGSTASVDAPRPAADAPIVDTSSDAPATATWSSGAVDIVQGKPFSARATAVFADTPTEGIESGSNGPCVDDHGLPDSGLSAGTLAVSGTITPLSLVPGGTAPLVHYDPSPDPPNPLFDAGAVVTVTAPSFSISTTAPATLAGFVPPTTPISRAAGYTATWTAGTGPLLEVVLETGTDVLTCTVPDTGSYTVEPESLALLPADATTVEVFVARLSQTSLTTPNVTLGVVSLIAAQTDVLFSP